MRCPSPIFLSYPRGIYLRIPARRYDGFNNPLFFFPKAICGRNPLYCIANLEIFHIIPRDSYARPTVWGMKSPAGGGRGVGCFNIEVTVRSFGDSYIESKQYADRVREYMLHILRVFSRLLSTDKLRNMYLYHRSVRSLCTFR